MTGGWAAPRLLFVILAHDAPSQVAELAVRLTGAATDARAIVHFDAGAGDEPYAALRRHLATAGRVRLARRRHRCQWGDFSLVAATLEALREAATEGHDFDYVVLLSGACVPCRPIGQLERWLSEQAGREFIEVDDERWVFDGLRRERHELYFFLRPRRRPWADRLSVRVQRAIGIRRRFPADLAPRFGSQWWALTWSTCRAIVDYTSAQPGVIRFFRRTWIPDELVFPTLVHALVPEQRIAGFNLTHYEFTKRGKPIVFYDDHVDLLADAPKFFVRKVAKEAGRFRARAFAIAAAADGGEAIGAVGEPRRAYPVRERGHTWYPRAGQAFYRSQYADQCASVLDTVRTPYVALVGPPTLVETVARHVDAGPFARFGRLFAPSAVEWGADHRTWRGLERSDAPLRDLHPALFLARVRERADAVPVTTWAFQDEPSLLQTVLDDPLALKVVCVPFAACAHAARRLIAHNTPRPASSWGIPPLPHAADAEIDATLAPPAAGVVRRLAEAPHERDAGTVVMCWETSPTRDTTTERAALFRRGLSDCRFRGEAWFPDLVAGLEAAWAHGFDTGRAPPVRADVVAAP